MRGRWGWGAHAAPSPPLPSPPAHPAPHGLDLHRRMRADLGMRGAVMESLGKWEKGVTRQTRAWPLAPLSPVVTGTQPPPT